MARTLLALGSLGTLMFTPTESLFHAILGQSAAPNCGGLFHLSLYCMLPEQLNLARWLAILGFSLVASGWRPRWTAGLHWWLSFSQQSSLSVTDGGDQITMVLCLLLLPVGLTDSRTWHWQTPSERATRGLVVRRLIAVSALTAIRAQVAAVYFHSVIGKLAVREWLDGTALYYYLNDPTVGIAPALVPLLQPLLRVPLGVIALTWGTLALELALFLAWGMPRRTHSRLLYLGLIFHGLIALIQGLMSFGLAMSAALLLYLGLHLDLQRPWRLAWAWMWRRSHFGYTKAVIQTGETRGAVRTMERSNHHPASNSP